MNVPVGSGEGERVEKRGNELGKTRISKPSCIQQIKR